jgi:hypothetical protein
MLKGSDYASKPLTPRLPQKRSLRVLHVSDMCAFQAYWSNQVGEGMSVRTCKNGAEDIVTEFNVSFCQHVFLASSSHRHVT